MQLTDLGDMILKDVLSRLSLEDLCRVREVCVHFCRLVDGVFHVWLRREERTTEEKQRALWGCVRSKRANFVDVLLGCQGVNPNDVHGRALRYACMIGDVKLVSVLLERQADVHVKTPFSTAGGKYLSVYDSSRQQSEDRDYADAPITNAVRGGHVGVVQMLLTAGAKGFSGFLLACQIGNVRLVRILANHALNENGTRRRSDAGAPLWDWPSGLNRASESGRLHVVQYLVDDVDIDPNLTDQTSVVKAYERGHTNVVRYLFRKGITFDFGRLESENPSTLESMVTFLRNDPIPLTRKRPRHSDGESTKRRRM